jgi:hypothetical protein
MTFLQAATFAARNETKGAQKQSRANLQSKQARAEPSRALPGTCTLPVFIRTMHQNEKVISIIEYNTAIGI